MRNLSYQFLPLLPWWWIALVLLALVGFLAYGCILLRRKEVPLRWVKRLAVLRALIIVVFALCLLQPVTSYTRTVEQLPEMLVLVDTSQSMGLPVAPDRETRLDHVRSILTDGRLAAGLRQRFCLHWFAFDRSAYPLESADLAGLKPAGDSTRYAESLTAAWSTLDPADGAAARVLLVSDGNDLGARDVAETARRLGVVIDTLAPPSAAGQSLPAVGAVTQVQCARRVLLGSETPFRVTLRGPADRPLTLNLREDGKEVLTRDVTFATGQDEQTIELSHRPAEVGLKQYEFRLAPKAPADAPAPEAGEERPYRVSVQVVDAKQQVLILDDTWRWEFKFLRRVFEDDPSFSFTALLPRGKGYLQFGEADRRVNLAGFPQTRAELEVFDTIVLGDVDPERWPRGLASALGRFVTDSGKSLVVVAGPNLDKLAGVAEVNRLLPVEVARESGTPVEGPIEVRVSDEGAQSAFFSQPAPGQEPAAVKASAGAWDLPPLDRIYAPLRKRPAATVLLQAAKQANAYGNLIVMAEQPVGRGRVLYIGTDTLWKWQTLAGSKETKTTPYTRFWQQALRALAPAHPSGGANLWLQADRSRYEVGRPVLVRAEVRADRPLLQPKVQATVVLPGDRRLPLAFAANPANPLSFQAELEPASPGQYRIQASLVSEGKSEAEVATAIDVEPARSELSAVRVDQANLARIARATGGKQIDPNDPQTWPSADDLPKVTAEQRRTLDLWNNFTLLLVLSGLLGLDWVLRLVRGFV